MEDLVKRELEVENMLSSVIRTFGFEHPTTISFGKVCEMILSGNTTVVPLWVLQEIYIGLIENSIEEEEESFEEEVNSFFEQEPPYFFIFEQQLFNIENELVTMTVEDFIEFIYGGVL